MTSEIQEDEKGEEKPETEKTLLDTQLVAYNTAQLTAKLATRHHTDAGLLMP
jgi:hypothetical protein